MKIYTKTGDKGTTALIGGIRVQKDHLQLEAYGTVDELIAVTGLVRSMNADGETNGILLTVQDKLMVAAANLAACDDASHARLPQVSEADILLLESEIDRMEAFLEPLQSFILPGGSPLVSYCHVARTVCRRAERAAIRAFGSVSRNNKALKYINRLSDYFFVLARYLAKKNEVEEIKWIPNQ